MHQEDMLTRKDNGSYKLMRPKISKEFVKALCKSFFSIDIFSQFHIFKGLANLIVDQLIRKMFV